jgi:hypothetical protein
MALQLGALRDALEAAQGMTPEMARKAAEEVAAHQDRLSTSRPDLVDVKSDLMLLKWMVGTNVALTLLVLGKQFGMLG